MWAQDSFLLSIMCVSFFRNFWVLSQSRTHRMDPEIFSDLYGRTIGSRNLGYFKEHTVKGISLVTFFLKSKNLCFPLAVLFIANSLVQSSWLDNFQEDRGLATFRFVSVCLLVLVMCCTLASQWSFVRRRVLMRPAFLFILKYEWWEQLVCKHINYSLVF